MMNASASGVSVVAVSRPMATAPLTPTARSGSTNGTSPREMASIVLGLTSTPTTSMPAGGQRDGGGQSDVAHSDHGDATGEDVFHGSFLSLLGGADVLFELTTGSGWMLAHTAGVG